MSKKVREERVNKLTGLNRVSKAMQTFLTAGVAADTPAVQKKLGGKFPRRSRLVSDPGVLPEATAAELEDFVKQVQTFKAGSGPGPTGLRPQFIKELVGEGDSHEEQSNYHFPVD